MALGLLRLEKEEGMKKSVKRILAAVSLIGVGLSNVVWADDGCSAPNVACESCCKAAYHGGSPIESSATTLATTSATPAQGSGNADTLAPTPPQQ